MKISVIIPVFNQEEKLAKTIESVLEQESKIDKEIILVNDGSTDQSKLIIKKYEEQYSKLIKGYEKKNGGLSDARNFGIERATGDYLLFLDAGDYLDTALFSQVEPYLEKNIEVIKYKMMTVDKEGKILEAMQGPVFPVCKGEEAFSKLFLGEDHYLEVACLYFYQRHYWNNHHFCYTLHTYHEDFGLTPLVISQAETAISTSIFGYYYVQDEGSITRHQNQEKKEKQLYDLLLHDENMKKVIEKTNLSKKAKQNLKSYYANTILARAKELEGESQQKFITSLKEKGIIHDIVPCNMKQWLKKQILRFNINWYLKLK